MGKKNETAVTPETEATEAPAVTEAPAATEAPEELVSIFPEPKEQDTEYIYLCVNGKGMYVKRGEESKVPKAFAEVYNNSLKQQTSSIKFQKKNEYKEIG